MPVMMGEAPMTERLRDLAEEVGRLQAIVSTLEHTPTRIKTPYDGRLAELYTTVVLLRDDFERLIDDGD